MKTKLFFFTSLLLLSIATATAQTKEKGFFVEMNGGYGEVKTAFVSSTVENPLLFHLGYARYAVLTPSIGYQINRHWAAGFKIQLESIMEDEKRTTYTPYMRYNFLHLNPEKPDVPLNKNDAFQKVQKRRVQEKR